jgi:low temperature requirement protein LtrA
MIVVSALWWLYFDVAAILARRRLMDSTGAERARLARDAYTYLHFPMIAGIVLFAFGLETTLHHLDDDLDLVAAVGLCAGTALYLLAQVGFLVRALGRVFRGRTVGAVLLGAAIPAALVLPALATLGLVAAVCASIVAYEAIARRDARLQVRHPEQT